METGLPMEVLTLTRMTELRRTVIADAERHGRYERELTELYAAARHAWGKAVAAWSGTRLIRLGESLRARGAAAITPTG